MITGQEYIERLKAAFPSQIQRSFAFPFTYVDIVSEDFPVDPEQREEILAARTNTDVPTLRALCNRLFLRLEPRRPEEPDERPANRGEFWMRALQGFSSAPSQPNCRVIHFYGYKGPEKK